MLMLEKRSTVMSLLGWSIENLAANNVKFLLDVEDVDSAVCGTGVYRSSAINALVLCMTTNCAHYDPIVESFKLSIQ